MAHTYTNLLIHAVYSTKHRRPLLADALRPELFSYMAGIVKKLKGKPILINGPKDHVHMLFLLPQALSLAECMEKLKANSSKWINERHAQRVRSAWQRGYAAFSVSRSNLGKVRAYIAGQQVHHQRMTFWEEVLAFPKKHGVQYDPRYVFD